MKFKILYFIVGAAVGSAVTYFAMRDHMERRIELEVEEVKETYKEAKTRQNASESVSEETDATVNVLTKNEVGKLEKETLTPKEIAAQNAQKKADLITNSNIISDQAYRENPISYNLFSKPPKASDIHNGIDEGEDLKVFSADRPYVISPDEFVAEHKEYDKTTLMYYTDGVLVEEMSRELITDIDEAIGLDSLNRFGEYEDDVVYVRNERISTDYEVIFNDVAFVDLYDDNG